MTHTPNNNNNTTTKQLESQFEVRRGQKKSCFLQPKNKRTFYTHNNNTHRTQETDTETDTETSQREDNKTCCPTRHTMVLYFRITRMLLPLHNEMKGP
jgi:hypothetical protein